MPQGRFGIVAVFSSLFLLLCTLIRILLWVVTPKGAALSLIMLVQAAATGFLFDLATLAYFLLPLALYLVVVPGRMVASRCQVWVFRAGLALLSAALIFDTCAEYLFFEEFGTRFNFIAIDYLIYTREVIGNIRESYPMLPIFVGIGIATTLISLLLEKFLPGAVEATFRGSYRRRGFLLLLPALLSLACVNVSQSEITNNSYANELAGNGIYNLFAAFRNNELSFARFYRTEPEKLVLRRLRTLVAERNNSYAAPGGERFTRSIRGEGPEKRLNVIVVVEESLSAEFLGSFGNKKNLTPNLDRLAKESLLFTHLYATGTRTVRGLEAVSLSLPPLPGTSIVKRPHNDGFRSWGEVMDSKGYDSKFIYGGYGYFDNMNAFFARNGFSIVDRSSLSGDEITFANAWGACDEDLFSRTIKEADRSYAAGKPFFSLLMTTSNHRPFTFPKARQIGAEQGGRDGGVKYADYAIGRLIAEAQKKVWFEDTLFVIVADHCAASAGNTEVPVKHYEIPLLVYSPHHVKPGRVDTLMSQIDVAPTVLGLLDMSYRTDFLGRDILKESGQPARAFISTYQKLGYLTQGHLLVLGPRRYAAQYGVNSKSGEVKNEPVEEGLLLDALAYYQGADYLYQHRLNRIK